MKIARFVSAAAVAAIAGQAFGQPVIDGVRDNAFYGTTPIWVNNQPTGFGNNTTTLCDPTALNNPGGVTTGVELAIPLSALGNPAAGSIRIAGFVNGSNHDFISNQAIGGMPSSTINLGEPRAASFATITGNQFVGSIGTSATPPTMNGLLDPAYGAAKFTQTVRTGFGDSNTTTPDFCNGSEIDALYAVVSGSTLYILVTGNLESNNNKLELFFDVNGTTTGQNQLRGDNPVIGGAQDGLNRMGDDLNTGAVEGLTFDAGFSPDYFVSVGGADQGGGVYGMFVDYAQLRGVATPTDPGVGYYCGLGTAQSSGTLTGGDPGAPALLATVDNSNIAGVQAICPPPAGNPDVANGSEIDAIYGKIANGKLYLLVAGNLETNYNALTLFFDVQPGGQNRMRGNNPNIDTGNDLNRLGDDGTGNGLLWDTDFSPDYFLDMKNGFDGQQHVQVYGHAAVLRTDGQITNGNGFPLDYNCWNGGLKTAFNPIPFAGPLIEAQNGFDPDPQANFAPRTAGASLVLNPTAPVGTPNLIKLAIDNSNLAGVSGVNVGDPNATGTTTGAELVSTGVELEIALPELTDTCTGACGSITSVKVGGFIAASNRSYISNQVIGGLPNTAGRAYSVNLAEPRTLDFTQLAGNQYVVITAGTAPACYANCDTSTTIPCLNVLDFSCFLNKFAAADSYANCDNSTTSPVLNVLDFSCFLNKFAAGCSAC